MRPMEVIAMTKRLYFIRPSCNQELLIDYFELREIAKSRWATIYENDKMCFSVNDKTISVSLIDENDLELENKLQKFFYEKRVTTG